MSNNNSGNACGGGGTGGDGSSGSGGNFITWTITTGSSGGWTVTIPSDIKPESKKKSNKDGCDCKKCKEFYPYAEPNQDDGTLLCYRCRTGW